jgi:hypothetical protein
MTSLAKRAAQARADAKRPAPVPVRLNPSELGWLDAQRQPDEGRGRALKRLAGVPTGI